MSYLAISAAPIDNDNIQQYINILSNSTINTAEVYDENAPVMDGKNIIKHGSSNINNSWR